jgi:nucleoid DNA-binding protein
MTKQTFIERLSKKADITAEQSSIIVNAIEDHNLFAKDEKALIVSDIAQQLGVGEDTAEKYFSHASQIVRSEIKNQSVKWVAGAAVIVIAGIIVFRLRKK